MLGTKRFKPSGTGRQGDGHLQPWNAASAKFHAEHRPCE
jgi:hypothetical protein